MIRIKKLKPMFNSIITTMDKYEKDVETNGIIDNKRQEGSLKEYQTVLAVGTTVRDIKEGDVVCIDPTRYMVTKHKDKSLQGNIVGDEIAVGYKFNTIKLQDKDCLMLFDQDISFIVEESEDVEDPTGPLIIQPERPSIIV